MEHVIIAVFQVVVEVHPRLTHIFYVVTSHDTARAEVHRVLLLVHEGECQVIRWEAMVLRRLLVMPFLPLFDGDERQRQSHDLSLRTHQMIGDGILTKIRNNSAEYHRLMTARTDVRQLADLVLRRVQLQHLLSQRLRLDVLYGHEPAANQVLVFPRQTTDDHTVAGCLETDGNKSVETLSPWIVDLRMAIPQRCEESPDAPTQFFTVRHTVLFQIPDRLSGSPMEIHLTAIVGIGVRVRGLQLMNKTAEVRYDRVIG